MKISSLSIPNLIKGSILNSPTRLEKLARKTRWLIRKPKKLPPIKFVHGILHAVSSGEGSFRLLATSIGLRLDNLDTSESENCFDTISKTALWERVSPASVEFFKAVLAETIKAKNQKRGDQIPALPSIKRILVEDSAKIALDERLVDEFPASKNQHKESAGVRLQGAMDLIGGDAVRLDLTPYKRNDQKASSDIIPYLRKGDLILRDLGYLVRHSLNEITECGAHFLSRFRGEWVVSHLKENGGKRIDLLNHLQTFAPQPGNEVELDVEIGSGHRNSPLVKCRFVARRIPQHVEEKRLRKIQQEEKRLGKQFSKTHKKLQGWEIYITSLPREEASVEKICEIYPLRWRVEIIFKAFKSYTPLNQLAKHCSNGDHVQVLLYAWLCLVVMATQTGAFALARKSGPNGVLQPNYLSLLKVIPKVFQLMGMSLLFSSAPNIQEIMGRWMHQCEYHDRYESRRKRTNMAEMLEKALEFHSLDPALTGSRP